MSSSTLGQITKLSISEWTSVLKLANKWGFTKLKEDAMDELTANKDISDAQKLMIAVSHVPEITALYQSAYRTLVERERPLSVDDGQVLGLDLSLEIGSARERRLKESLQDALTPNKRRSKKRRRNDWNNWN